MNRIMLALLLTVCTVEAKLPVNRIHSRRGCAIGICQVGQGTGVPIRLMDGRLIWTTAGHCLGDWNAIEIDGRRYESTVIARVPVNDLIPDEVVYLKTKDVVARDSVTLWVPEPDYVPKRGDRLWLVGFPRGKYQRVAAEVLTVDGDQFTVLPHAEVGASGGAVILQDGNRLIGTIHAYYQQGKREGIMSRFDVVSDRLLRDGHSYLVANARKKPPITQPIAQDEINRLITDALEGERKKVTEEAKTREEKRAEELENLKSQLQDLKSRQQAPVKPPVTPPVEKSDPDPIKEIEEPQRASESLLNRVPWGLIGTGLGLAGVAIPGGALGVLGLRLLTKRRRRQKGRGPSPLFQRDTGEAEQLLQLRAEERSPVNDAVFGMLWQDFAKTHPNATVKEAEDAVLRKFIEIAPLSTPQENE